jgi:hypothetical protein
MDKATLVEPAIEAGKKLIVGLDEERFDVRAAFWFYREESEEWRLYIATPLVKQVGPRAAYSKILEVLKKKNIQDIDLSNVTVVDVTDGLVTILRYAVHTGREISDIAFNGNSVNGVYIRAAHIYRMLE